MKRLTAILGAIALLCCCAQRIDNVPADHPGIRIEGARHIDFADGKATIERIDPALFGPKDFRISHAVAMAPSGVRILFRTDSPEIRLRFERRPEGKWRESTWYYGVYCDSEFLCDVPGKDPVIKAPSKGMHEYRVVLPIMNPELFCGLSFGSPARIKPAREVSRPVYFAIGDSITHGTGQVDHGSQISWPFIVAEEHGYDLYNLAVGASQITPDIYKELLGVKTSVVTVMWGFNDWNNTKGDIPEITRRYTSLLENLLAAAPEARIYCILPSAAKVESGKPGYAGDLEDVRDAERAVVEGFQKGPDGSRIHLINGRDCSNAEDDLSDGVHFSNAGAERFAAAVGAQMW